MERVTVVELVAGTFEGLVGAPFRVAGAAAELVELRENGPQSFALVFRVATQLGQGMHEVQQESIGTFELFLVPIGATRDGILCEAVFNRAVSA